MKNTILFFVIFFTVNCYSQSLDDSIYAPYFGTGTFLLKGKIENKPADIAHWNLAVTGYISNVSHKIMLADDGSFEEEIPITDVQDIYLYLGETITIFSYPNDTIELYFDNNNLKETLRLKGKNADREKELALCLLIYEKYRQAFLDINGLAYDGDIQEEELLSKLNEYYDNKIETINFFEKENGEFVFLKKIRDETYFEITRQVTRKKELLTKIHCEYPDGISLRFWDNNVDTIPRLPYETLDYERFRTNYTYRSFLEFYISASMLNFYPVNTFVKNNYYFALSCLNNDAIRDWYITHNLNVAFTYYDFEDVASTYNEFKKICQNKEYLDLLERKYQAALQTQPGSPAPDFELVDDTGKTVKLSDLRGKIVYMDFWGTSCGPCVSEFKNYVPGMREKYKDFDIAYLYINVSDNEDRWKRGIESYNLQGINLIAEGWEEHPVCQAYNVLGIPHYVLIDKEGKIVSNKCDRPSLILKMNERSEFDRFVREEK